MCVVYSTPTPQSRRGPVYLRRVRNAPYADTRDPAIYTARVGVSKENYVASDIIWEAPLCLLNCRREVAAAAKAVPESRGWMSPRVLPPERDDRESLIARVDNVIPSRRRDEISSYCRFVRLKKRNKKKRTAVDGRI